MERLHVVEGSAGRTEPAPHPLVAVRWLDAWFDFELAGDEARAASHGFTMNAGMEAEFFMFKLGPDGAPTTATHDAASYFDLAPVDLGEDARRAVDAGADAVSVSNHGGNAQFCGGVLERQLQPRELSRLDPGTGGQFCPHFDAVGGRVHGIDVGARVGLGLLEGRAFLDAGGGQAGDGEEQGEGRIHRGGA